VEPRAYERGLYWALCVLAASIPTEAFTVGYDGSTGTGIKSPAYYLGVIVAVMALPLSARIVALLLEAKPILLLTIAFLVAYTVLGVYVLAGQAQLGALFSADKQAKLVLLATLFLGPARLPVWRRRLVLSYIAGWGLFIAVSLFLLLTGQSRNIEASQGARVSVLGMNENSVSIFAAAGLILLFAELQSGQQRSKRILTGTALIGGAVVFLLGVSRTGLVGLAAGIVVAAASLIAGNVRSWKLTVMKVIGRAAIPGVLAAVVVLGSQTLSPTLLAWDYRIEAAIDGTDRGYREELNDQSLKLALEYPQGLGQDRAWNYLGGYDPHNGYLKLLVEGGFLALGFLVAAYFTLAYWSLKLLQDKVNAGLLGVFAMFAITTAVGQDMANLNYWFFLALVCGSAMGQRRTKGNRVAGHAFAAAH
jgi:O-antigen ligase